MSSPAKLRTGKAGNEQAGWSESETRRLIEIAIEKTGCNARGVEAIQHQNIGITLGHGQIVCSVGLDDCHAFLDRHVERAAQGDDIGADLNHGQACVRHMPIAELGERTTAEPDHQQMIRVGHEQQKGHHFASVGKIERKGIVDAHRTSG